MPCVWQIVNSGFSHNNLIIINSKMNLPNGPELSQLWKSFSSNNARYRSEESSLMKVRLAGSEYSFG